VNKTINIRFNVENFESIQMWDHFYKVVFNTIGVIPKTRNGNQYILVAIDHYSKWVKIKIIKII
jgi:hypothetical protein